MLKDKHSNDLNICNEISLATGEIPEYYENGYIYWNGIELDTSNKILSFDPEDGCKHRTIKLLGIATLYNYIANMNNCNCGCEDEESKEAITKIVNAVISKSRSKSKSTFNPFTPDQQPK